MLLSNKASVFAFLWLPFLFACEMYRPENVRIPPTVGTLNAEFEALPLPNSYQAKISWTHLEPPD